MCGFKNYRTQLVEIVVPGVSGGNQQTKIQFTDQPYLRNKPHLWLSTYTATDVPVSPQQNAVATAANIAGAFITFYTTDVGDPTTQGEWLQLVPLCDLHQIQNATPDPFNREKFLLNGQTIIWEKSYITLSAALANTANVSFLLNVGFMAGGVNPNVPSD